MFSRLAILEWLRYRMTLRQLGVAEASEDHNLDIGLRFDNFIVSWPWTNSKGRTHHGFESTEM